MTNKIRDLDVKLDIISKLLDAIEKYPDWRFCQIISNITTGTFGTPPDIFYVEDVDFLKCLSRRLNIPLE